MGHPTPTPHYEPTPPYEESPSNHHHHLPHQYTPLPPNLPPRSRPRPQRHRSRNLPHPPTQQHHHHHHPRPLRGLRTDSRPSRTTTRADSLLSDG
ncbi:hypothetical protein ASPCADRAFT_206640, partial [Aspergillus carbonarius ITEM 5010]